MTDKLSVQCAWCKKFHLKTRNGKEWLHVTSVVTDDQISHGICPDCRKKYFSEVFTNKE